MSDTYLTGWDEYTEITRETADYPGYDTDAFKSGKLDTPEDLTKRILYCTLGLSGEAGEVVDVVKKDWRKHNRVTLDRVAFDRLSDELGDVLWYLARLMDEASIDIDSVIARNVAKLRARKEAGTIKER